MKVGVVIKAELGQCEYYRLYLPYKTMKSLGEDIIFFVCKNTLTYNISDIEKLDYLVFHYAFFDWKFINICKDINPKIKLIVDIDDMLELHSYHVIHRTKTMQSNFEKLAKEADIVTTTTINLKNYLQKYNSNVYILKNSIPIPEINKQHEGFVVGYTGSYNHLHDINTIPNIVQDIIDLGSDTKFLYYHRDNPYCQSFEATVLKNKLLKHRLIKASTTYPQYFIQEYSKFDVSLAPLKKDKFNSCKSNLKLIEAGATKTLFIGTNWYPYEELPENCGFLCDSKKDFVDALYMAYNYSEFKEQVENNLYTYVKNNYNIEKIVQLYIDFLKKLIIFVEN